MSGKTMKIAFIGPGILPIPPNGWGAVELLVWEYAKELGELGHSGTIINTPDHDQIIRELTEDGIEYDYDSCHDQIRASERQQNGRYATFKR